VTDQAVELENDTIAVFMNRTASAFGRDEPAPDPTLILIKAELAERELRERRVARHKLVGIGLSCVAVMTSVWIAIRFAGPMLVGLDSVLTLAGASLLVVPLVVWYFGLRPLARAL